MQRNGSRDSARVDWQEVSLQWHHTISILMSICPIEHLFSQDADKEIPSFVETDSGGPWLAVREEVVQAVFL